MKTENKHKLQICPKFQNLNKGQKGNSSILTVNSKENRGYFYHSTERRMSFNFNSNNLGGDLYLKRMYSSHMKRLNNIKPITDSGSKIF